MYIGNLCQVRAIWSVYHRMHRQIFLINVSRTSSTPIVVTGYFMEAGCQFKSCTRLVRSDMGTENVDVARMQRLMSGESSFLVGIGTHNQRIESF